MVRTEARHPQELALDASLDGAGTTRSAALTLRRNVGRVARELALWPRILSGGRRPRVAFFPSAGRWQSSLLRCYEVAPQLEALGWTAIVVHPNLTQGQRRRITRAFRPDLCIVQKARHALNRREHFAGFPYVFDVDDADYLDPVLTATMEDTVRGARGVICGSEFIRSWALGLNRHAEVVWTGTRPNPPPWPPHTQRAAIVTWAQASPLDYPAEFEFLRTILKAAKAAGAEFTFRLYGWTAGQTHAWLQDLQQSGIPTETLPPMPYDSFMASLRSAAVGLSPIISDSPYSRGKSFGKILGYLDARVPVICSDEGDHARFFEQGAGIVSNDPQIWIDAVTSLLAHPASRQQMADRAHALFLAHLSLQAAADKTSRFLHQLIADPVKVA